MVAIVIYWQSLSTPAILSWLLWMLSLCLLQRRGLAPRPLGFECAVRAQEMAISPRNLIKLSQSSSKSDERPRAAAKHLSCSCLLALWSQWSWLPGKYFGHKWRSYFMNMVSPFTPRQAPDGGLNDSQKPLPGCFLNFWDEKSRLLSDIICLTCPRSLSLLDTV